MNTGNIYLAIKIISAYILIKLVLLFFGIEHFYNITSDDKTLDNKTARYIRNFLEDITIIGFIIMFII
jgi:putative copper export protein